MTCFSIMMPLVTLLLIPLPIYAVKSPKDIMEAWIGIFRPNMPIADEML